MSLCFKRTQAKEVEVNESILLMKNFIFLMQIHTEVELTGLIKLLPVYTDYFIHVHGLHTLCSLLLAYRQV